MNRILWLAMLALIVSSLLLKVTYVFGSAPPPHETETGGAEAAQVEPWMLDFFAPIPAEATPADYEMTEDLIDLGRILFYEPRLSINQQMSCNSCHSLPHYGVESSPTAVSHDGNAGGRNSPTVYHAAFHTAQFWDGRSPHVEDQAKGPVLAAGEMGMPSGEYVERVLTSIPGYEPLFAAAFPGELAPVTFDNAAMAIAAFERRLVTPSRFDSFLQGDASQLSEEEKQGLATFVTVGCVTCHAGATIGGGLFGKLGVVEPYATEDLGRFEVTGDDSDKHVFKVPSLRNIAKTAPYLHDGSIASLDEMVRLMGRYQLGRQLTDAQVTDIVAFLDSLTGEIPEAYIAQPELPESGPDTPGPYEGN